MFLKCSAKTITSKQLWRKKYLKENLEQARMNNCRLSMITRRRACQMYRLEVFGGRDSGGHWQREICSLLVAMTNSFCFAGSFLL